jgi:hypothetical protein
MTTNGVTNRKAADEGMVNVTDDGIHDDMGGNLSYVKTSGGMTISPELFEKVWASLHFVRTFFKLGALNMVAIALLDPKDCCGWRFPKAIRESNTSGTNGVRAQFRIRRN